MLRALADRFSPRDTSPTFGREIIAAWCAAYMQSLPADSIRVLDIGCHAGSDLRAIRRAAAHRQLELLGVEHHCPAALLAAGHGIQVLVIDIEREALPLADASVDIVVVNQVIEHTKEIFWIFSEVARVLKPGGLLVVGIPNLASLHNRLLLLLGEQPTTIELVGPHVRGITAPSFKRFIETNGYFSVQQVAGANFYLLPRALRRPASRLLPSFAVALFFAIERRQKAGNFLDVLDDRFFQTVFFRGVRSDDHTHTPLR